jgi:hypothetical protein
MVPRVLRVPQVLRVLRVLLLQVLLLNFPFFIY